MLARPGDRPAPAKSARPGLRTRSARFSTSTRRRWRARDPLARAEFLAQPAIAHLWNHEPAQATLDRLRSSASYPLPHENGPSEWPWLVDSVATARPTSSCRRQPRCRRNPALEAFGSLTEPPARLAGSVPCGPTRNPGTGWRTSWPPPTWTPTALRDLLAVSRFDGREPPASRADRPAEPARSTPMCSRGRTATRSGAGTWIFRRTRLRAIGQPRWWGRGPDGWPLLAFPWAAEIPTAPADSYRIRN